MNINDLNDDCLSCILCFIPFKQLITNRIVCKHWQHTIDYLVSNTRYFTYNQSINWCKTDEYFYRYQENVETLMNLNRFESCVKLMPNLVSLTLRGVKANDAMLPILGLNCHRITRLHLMSGEESLTFVGFKYLVNKYRNLSHLDVPNCQLDDDLVHIIVFNLRHLVHFNFATDRNQAFRLSRFTGHTLSNMSSKMETLMIGESMYWDDQFVPSIISANVSNITTLKLHLIKLRVFRVICENMPQLKQFYCSFNGGDINTHENNVGCIRHVEHLRHLEVLELIDDGRHHCGINGCSSVYTQNSLMQVIKACPKLRSIKLLDYDNWHSIVPNIDPVLSCLKHYCQHLEEFGVSGGELNLGAESFGLISMLNVKKLTIQGDTSIAEVNHFSNNNRRQDIINNQVITELVKRNTRLTELTVENCALVGEDALNACLDIARKRFRERFKFIFLNTRLHSAYSSPSFCDSLNLKIPENVTLYVSKDDDPLNINLNDIDSYSSWSSYHQSDSEEFNSDDTD